MIMECSKCGESKPTKEFNKEQAKLSNTERICNDCDPPLPSDLSILTVVQIKGYLKQRGELNLVGKKAALIERLQGLLNNETEKAATNESAAKGEMASSIVDAPSAVDSDVIEETGIDNETIIEMAESPPVDNSVAVEAPKEVQNDDDDDVSEVQSLITVEDILSFKVVDLKSELKKRGVAAKGRKADLQKLLAEYEGLSLDSSSPTKQKNIVNKLAESMNKLTCNETDKEVAVGLVANQHVEEKESEPSMIDITNNSDDEEEKFHPSMDETRDTITLDTPNDLNVSTVTTLSEYFCSEAGGIVVGEENEADNLKEQPENKESVEEERSSERESEEETFIDDSLEGIEDEEPSSTEEDSTFEGSEEYMPEKNDEDASFNTGVESEEETSKETLHNKPPVVVFFNNSANDSENKENDATTWKNVRPQDGIEMKVVNNTTYYWCNKCKGWTQSHNTSQHVNKGNKKRKNKKAQPLIPSTPGGNFMGLPHSLNGRAVFTSKTSPTV